MTVALASGFFNNPTNNVQGDLKDGWDALIEVSNELPGGGALTTLEIDASGNVTPIRASHAVDTNGQAASDYLDHIVTTNHPAGRLLRLRAAHPDRTVTIRHNQGGAGEILLNDGNFDLDDDDKWIDFIQEGGLWKEVERFHGADRATRRIFCDRELAYRAGLIIEYSGVQAITVSGGELVISDGTTPKLFSVASQLTKGSLSLALGHYFAYAVIPSAGRTLTATEIVLSTTIPVWSHSKMGWYNNNNRCIGTVLASGTDTLRLFTRSGRTVRFANVTVFDANVKNTPGESGATIDLSNYCPKLANIMAQMTVKVTWASGAAGNVLMRTDGIDNAMVVGRRLSTASYSLNSVEVPVSADAKVNIWGEGSDDECVASVTLHGYEEPNW